MKLLLLLSLLALLLAEKALCQFVDIKNINQHLDKHEEALFWKILRDSTKRSGQTVVDTLKEQVPRFKMEHPELPASRRGLRLRTSSQEAQRVHHVQQ